jgi:hypothetical protein
MAIVISSANDPGSPFGIGRRSRLILFALGTQQNCWESLSDSSTTGDRDNRLYVRLDTELAGDRRRYGP